MTKYAVILLTDEQEPGRVAKILSDSTPPCTIHYADERVYFARYTGTAQQLSERVGFSGGENAQAGIVMEVGQYFGYANKDLWNWLRSP